MSAMSTNGDVGHHGSADDAALAGYGVGKSGSQSLWGDPVTSGLLRPDMNLLLDFIASEEGSLLFIVMDAKEKILSCNKALELLTGWTAADIRGKYLWDIFMPFDGDKGQNTFSDRPARGAFPLEYENYIITRDGARKYTVWRGGRLIREKNGDERIALAGLDMTERKKRETLLCKKIKRLARVKSDMEKLSEREKKNENNDTRVPSPPIETRHMNGVENPSLTPELMALEEQFRTVTSIFENAGEGIMIMDVNGAIRCVNPALCAATGYSVGDLVGKTPAVLNSDRHDESFYDGVWRSLAGTGKWRGEMWSKRKNGEVYPAWVSISAIKDPSGRASQYMSISVDMSGAHENGEMMGASSVAGAVQ